MIIDEVGERKRLSFLGPELKAAGTVADEKVKESLDMRRGDQV